MITQYRINASCLSNIGKIRSRNEDACAVCLKNNYFLVADGIGGAAAGDVASRLFSQYAKTFFEKRSSSGHKDPGQEMVRFFRAVNGALRLHSKTHPQCSGMGCTGELLSFDNEGYVIGHVGDSRTYLLRPGSSLELLTNDHSLVQKQVEQGILSRTQARKSKMKNILLRAVGTTDTIEADIIRGDLAPGMLFLLCTDGLYNMVTEEQIQAILEYSAPLEFKAEILVNMANDAGGKDNISLSLVEISV